jgi:drug/metabolite transporter (DMT)-like permease
MVIGLVAALLAAVLFGVGAVVQAVAARRHGLLSALMGLVVLMYCVGWGLHLLAIAWLPLYVAQVGVSVSLVVTALVASTVVGEPLGTEHWAAIAAMAVGLAMLVTAAGDVGHHDFDTGTTATLYAVLLITLLLGLGVARLRDAASGVWLAVLAGLAYAGSPVATRALVEPAWDLDVLVPALTIALFGLLGFWLYSLAMARTSVTAATAPVVLLQTVLPAVVGVVTFDDLVRPGWWPVALVGFVMSTVGALVLCTAQVSLDHLEQHHAPMEQSSATD